MKGVKLQTIAKDLKKNEERLKRASESHSNISYKILDVRDISNISKIADEMAEKKELPDVVINNAAGNFISSTEKLTQNGWNAIQDIVLKGTFAVTHELGKKMMLSVFLS